MPRRGEKRGHGRAGGSSCQKQTAPRDGSRGAATFVRGEPGTSLPCRRAGRRVGQSAQVLRRAAFTGNAPYAIRSSALDHLLSRKPCRAAIGELLPIARPFAAGRRPRDIARVPLIGAGIARRAIVKVGTRSLSRRSRDGRVRVVPPMPGLRDFLTMPDTPGFGKRFRRRREILRLSDPESRYPFACWCRKPQAVGGLRRIPGCRWPLPRLTLALAPLFRRCAGRCGPSP